MPSLGECEKHRVEFSDIDRLLDSCDQGQFALQEKK